MLAAAHRGLRGLGPAGTVLGCYAIWYGLTVWWHFDPAPSIWLNALGIAVVVGLALWLSVGGHRGRLDRWQTTRLFVMPFCVSSFSALVKDQGYLLILPPRPAELLASAGACAGFLLLVVAAKRFPGPGRADQLR